MARFLFTSDIHLTSRPRDEYRWEIFPWLEAQAKRRKADAVFILGDVTDKKDHHPSALVNRLAEALKSLARTAEVHVLTGNHDCVDPDRPFFLWCDDLPGVHWYEKIAKVRVAGKRILMIPHQRKWGRSGPKKSVLAGNDFILMHQTITGSRASNGQTMDGVGPGVFRAAKVGRRCVVLSGDIHVPQTVGNVTYCGSPHPVAMGDDYETRVLFYDGKKVRSLHRTTIRKAHLTIRSAGELRRANLSSGDQVRVTLVLAREDLPSWDERRAQIRKAATKLGVILYGPSLEVEDFEEQERDAVDAPPATDPVELFGSFCVARGVPDEYVEAGRRHFRA